MAASFERRYDHPQHTGGGGAEELREGRKEKNRKGMRREEKEKEIKLENFYFPIIILRDS
jgi:hypothetical protein